MHLQLTITPPFHLRSDSRLALFQFASNSRETNDKRVFERIWHTEAMKVKNNFENNVKEKDVATFLLFILNFTLLLSKTEFKQYNSI